MLEVDLLFAGHTTNARRCEDAIVGRCNRFGVRPGRAGFAGGVSGCVPWLAWFVDAGGFALSALARFGLRLGCPFSFSLDVER